MAMVRVIEAQKAREPTSLDEVLDRRTFGFENNRNDVNTVSDFVVNDLKMLSAMGKAQDKAEELVKLAAKDGWDSAIEKLNKYYLTINKEVKKEGNETPDYFSLQTRTNLRRISSQDMFTLRNRYQGDPLGRELLNRTNIERLLIDQFYGLVSDDANDLNKPAVVEFRPGLGYYCVKDIVIHRMYQEQFDFTKGREIMRSSFDNGQTLALTFYNPENILKRANFQLTEQREEQAGPAQQEPNKPASGAEANNVAGK